MPLEPLSSTADDRPPLPNPGRSAHPAGQDLSRSDGTRSNGSLSFGALRRIAAGLAQAQEPVPLSPDGDTDAPRSVRLLATAFYDVWLITWPDRSGLEAHDHGHARSVMQVVEGELIEVLADRGKPEDPTVRMLRHGSLIHADPSVVHALTNRSGVDVTTLHVYSPPLVDFTYLDLHSPGGCEALRSTSVGERAAQASTKETAPSGPAPLWLVSHDSNAQAAVLPPHISEGQSQAPNR
jgi:Cysteine dioxygenase type I